MFDQTWASAHYLLIALHKVMQKLPLLVMAIFPTDWQLLTLFDTLYN